MLRTTQIFYLKHRFVSLTKTIVAAAAIVMSTHPEDVEVAAPVAPPEEAAPAVIEKTVDPSSVPFPKNRKKKIVFVGLVFCVVGLAVGLGVGLSNKNKRADNNPTTMMTSESVDLLCTMAEDLNACRTACEAASCCFETPADESCLEEEGDSCDDYESCLVLTEEDVNNDENGTESGSALEEPSEEVQTVCNGDYNAELTCEEVCQPAACCPEYLEDDSCYTGNEDICDMWLNAGCFNLSINEQDPEEDTGDGGYSDSALEEPTLQVETVCKGDYNATLTCEEVCQPAACCPAYLEEDSCYEGNEEVCDMWLDAGCFNLAVDFEEP
jgi:hypothetical protein